LERRLPKVYGRRERHEIANADDASFRISAAPSFDPDKLTVEELEQGGFPSGGGASQPESESGRECYCR
jgi:hypothetical protein